MSLETNLASLQAFKETVKLRINVPTIARLYQRFEDEGLEQTSWEIINGLSEAERRPLLYTLTTHVTKEKPVFVYAIGKSDSVDQARAKFVAASTDLLWSLSLMLDDVVDNDTQRAGKETAWVVYGKERIKDNVNIVLHMLLQEQAQRISPQAAVFLQDCVDEGIKSLFAAEIHSLESTEEDILQNIDQRASFHCKYPMKAIFEGSEEGKDRLRLGTEALLATNRAGQILNDVKDLVPSSLYGRPLFSDIIGGIATLPLLMMANALKGADQRFLAEVFGRKELDPKALSNLENKITVNLPRSRIYQKISSIYKRFIDIMRMIVAKNDLDLCDEWVQYKMSQANKLLLEHP